MSGKQTSRETDRERETTQTDKNWTRNQGQRDSRREIKAETQWRAGKHAHMAGGLYPIEREIQIEKERERRRATETTQIDQIRQGVNDRETQAETQRQRE